jgi:hypothetical protein
MTSSDDNYQYPRLKSVLMQQPIFRGQPDLTLTFISKTGKNVELYRPLIKAILLDLVMTCQYR